MRKLLCKIFGHGWKLKSTQENQNEIWRCGLCKKEEVYQIGDLLHRLWKTPQEFGPDYRPVLEVGKHYFEITNARYDIYGRNIWWVAPECTLNVSYSAKDVKLRGDLSDG